MASRPVIFESLVELTEKYVGVSQIGISSSHRRLVSKLLRQTQSLKSNQFYNNLTRVLEIQILKAKHFGCNVDFLGGQ